MSESIPMSEAARAAQREYYRQYRKKNSQKIRDKNARYWEKKARELIKKEKDDHE